MNKVEKYAIRSLFKQNEIDAESLINAINTLELTNQSIFIEALIKNDKKSEDTDIQTNKCATFQIIRIPEEKLYVAKLLRNVTNSSLIEAKHIIDNLGQFKVNLTKEITIDYIYSAFRNVDTIVKLLDI